MSQTDMSEGEVARDLSEALDWRARRTWLVFGTFAFFLGTLSGTIIVISDVISQLVVRGDGLNVIAMGISLAAHLCVLSILSRVIPLRRGDGGVVHGYRIPGNPPLNVLPSFWRYLAWVGAVSLVAFFVIRAQPFFTLTATIGIQAVLAVILAPFTAYLPASVLAAKSNVSPHRSEPG